MSTFDAQGWYTKAVNYANGAYRSPNFGFPNQGDHGNLGRVAVVLHVTDGTDSRGWLCNPASNVSATFLIREEGIYQLVSIFDSPYANGIWEPGHAWRGTPDSVNPNRTTISIEREGRPAVPVSTQINALTVQLLRDLQEPFPQFRPYVPHVNLIGHYEISPFHRPNCPGPTVDFAGLAAEANGATPVPDPWFGWGNRFPLSPEQRGWAIPQEWLKRPAQFGAAVSEEKYETPTMSVRVFEHGAILYNKITNRAYPVLF